MRGMPRIILASATLAAIVALSGCAGDPVDFSTSSETQVNEVAEQQKRALALPAARVEFREDDFYGLRSPNVNSCPGDIRALYDPFEVDDSGDKAVLETSLVNASESIRPGFIKNVSVDVTDASYDNGLEGSLVPGTFPNSIGENGTNEALSCSYGQSTIAPPTSNCAAFDTYSLPALTWTTVDDFLYPSGPIIPGDASGQAIGLDGSGNIYVAGFADDDENATVSTADLHWIVRKTTALSSGSAWTMGPSDDGDDSQTGGFDSAANAFARIEGPTRILVAGYDLSGGVKRWYVKLSADEGASWSDSDTFQIGGAEAEARSIATGIAVSGEIHSYAAGYATDGTQKKFIVRRRLNSTGAWSLVSNYELETGSDAEAFGVAVGPDNEVYAVGSGEDDGSKHWVARRSADLAASFSPLSTGPGERFQYVDGADAEARAVVVGSDGATYVAGWASDGSARRWITRKSSDGGETWTTVDDFQLVSGSDAEPRSLAVDSTGAFYAAGYASDGTARRWIVRKSRADGESWQTIDDFQLADGETASAMGIAVRTDGTIFVTGEATVGGVKHWVTRRSSGASQGGGYHNSRYDRALYTLLDFSCVGAGPISGDSETTKLLAGGIYFDIDRAQLGARENLLLNLKFLPLGPENTYPDGLTRFPVSESAFFKVHLINTGQPLDTLLRLLQPRHIFYADTGQFPVTVDTLSVIGPPTGQVTETQLVLPISLNAGIDRIRVERYSGSAIFIDASLFRLGQK